MNAEKLFDLIEQTPDNYLEDAETFENVPTVQVFRRKPLLIAAIIVLIIALAGCTALAVSLLNMDSAIMGHYRMYAMPEEVPFMSYAGPAGSPEHEAAREWTEFRSEYDPDFEILNSLGDTDEAFTYGLDVYNCYTQEMADKVYEIAEKYNLKLMGECHHPSEPLGYYELDDFMFEFLDLYGIGNYISVPDGVYSFQSLQYYYDDGTFNGGGTIQFPEDSLWKHKIDYYYYCAVKGSFNPIHCNVSGIQEAGYEEWTHKTPDGTIVTLLLSEGAKKAIIFAETDEYVITIRFDPTHYSYYYDETYVMSREAIEAFADLFTFTFSITPPQN